jgi:sugar phosphate isomerase/epimerase
MKAAVTVSLVPEARGGPFIYWDDLAGACRKAAKLGYAAIEVFPPSAAELDADELGKLLKRHGLALATLGTGGGWVRERLTLTSSKGSVRKRARKFVERMIDAASPFGAGVILGSMQGRAEGDVSRSEALNLLGEALSELGDYAHNRNVVLLYEHLNRYETNLLNRVEDVVPFVKPFNGRVKILADLFHMSIEEASIAEAVRAGDELIGHVHFADSNRRPAGMGHTDFEVIFEALRDIGYGGYVSAEALPYPDSNAAARQTIQAFRTLMKRS